jgi:hypothetical protein
MKTTIFSRTFEPDLPDRKKKFFVLILNLVLASSYLVVDILLSSTQSHRGFSGGMGGGMGNAANLALPSFLILFSILTLLHLISLFQTRLPVRLHTVIGLGLIISGTMTMSLLFFVHQSANLLQSVYPVPVLVYCSLALSLFFGMYEVIQQIRSGQWVEFEEQSNTVASFPLHGARYRNVRILAEGGVGTIWYAERFDDNKQVVVKVPRRDDETTGISFMQEINLWRDLDHENIATVLSANILPVPYIEIEYLPGSLADMKKPVPLPTAVHIIRGLISALIYAHNRGVSHCDIKPSNILLTGEGVPKLTDWGLARSGSPRWSVSGFSPRYASPEQHSTHECGFSTDIWQIGMVFSELLTGRTKKPSGYEPVFLRKDGSSILPILLTCLATDPKERYPSVEALLKDLNNRYPAG